MDGFDSWDKWTPDASKSCESGSQQSGPDASPTTSTGNPAKTKKSPVPKSRRRKPLPRAALLIDTSEQREWPMGIYQSKYVDFVLREWNLPEGDYAAVLLCEAPEVAYLIDQRVMRDAGAIRSEALAIESAAPQTCLIERKSLADLVGTMTRGHDRFEAECERMRPYGERHLVIEADMPDVKTYCETESRANPKSIFGSVSALACRYNLMPHWAHDRRYAARWAFLILERWIRERTNAASNLF